MQTSNTHITRLRRALVVNNVVFAISLLLIWTLAVPTPAQAYVDPSVMTYTIQALAGVAVALSAVAGIAFRRSRKIILKALHVEEKRVTEPAVSSITPDQKAAVDAAAKTTLAASILLQDASGDANLSSYRPQLRSRLISALCVSLFFSVTWLLVAPYELIAGNEASLIYGLGQTWQVFILPALLVTVVLTAILTVIRGKAYNVCLMLLFGFTFASYMQVLFLNGTLPSSDGSTVMWESYTKIAVFSFIAWTLICLAPLELSRLNRDMAKKIVTIASVCFILIQGVGIGSLFVKDAQQAAVSGYQRFVTSEKGMLKVSAKKNVVIFVLDMYDETMDLRPIMKKSPHLLSEMTGFTWYQNTAAVITPTRDAIPTMLTGYAPNHEANYYAMGMARFEKGTYLTDFKKAGYDIGIYTDTLSTQPAYIHENVSNVVDINESAKTMLNRKGMLKAIYQCAAFRNLPWAFKPFFWFYTDDINAAMLKKQDDSKSFDDLGAYATNDPVFAKKLHTYGLTVDEKYNTGSVRFIHLMGPHYPYTMNEDMVLAGDATREKQAIGSMNIVRDYIREMKRLGIYDNATIIITSDHGYFKSSAPLSKLTEAACPILLVKPPQTHEEASAPVAISPTQPVSNGDVFPTALAAEGIPVTYKGLGENVLALNDPNRVRYFLALSKDEQGVEHGTVEYKITGDATQIRNWELTGWALRYPEGEWDPHAPIS